jgi:dienelactone hydrolase
MKKKQLLVFLFVSICCMPSWLSAQTIKKPLTPAVYDNWKSIDASALSNNGRYAALEVNAQQGDGRLNFIDLQTQKHDSVNRAGGVLFSPNSNYFVARIKMSYADQHKKKLAKKDKEIKDTLLVHVFDGKDKKFAKLKTFRVPEKESNWFAMLLDQDVKKDSVKKNDSLNKKADTAKLKKPASKAPKHKSEIVKTDLGELVISNPITDKEYRFKDVKEYGMSTNGQIITMIRAWGDAIDSTEIAAFNSTTEKLNTIYKGPGYALKPTADWQGSQMAYLVAQDTGKIKRYALYNYNFKTGKPLMVADTATTEFIKGWSLSENGNISYSEDGTKLLFAVAPRPKPEPKDSLIDDEKARYDVWSWTDEELMTMQLKNVAKDKKKSYIALYNIAKNKIFQLTDENMESVSFMFHNNGDWALGNVSKPYKKDEAMKGTNPRDIYLINLNTGEKKLLLKKSEARASLSPAAKYLLYYSQADSTWNCMNLQTFQPLCLTKNLNVKFYDEEHDTPDPSTAYGQAGWTQDDKQVLLYDHFDIWSFDPTMKKQPEMLTKGVGREQNIMFRYSQLDNEVPYIAGPMLLDAFNTVNKQSGFYRLDQPVAAVPTKLVMGEFKYIGERKAKNANVMLWAKSTFQMFPDLWTSNMDFTDAKRISDVNPQQKDYLWGTAELVSWTAFDGQKLNGLLYKPENFDPSKKYPLLVYYYERNSDNLYAHSTPRPSRSIINTSFCVSNGYVVFVPDITYKTGFPGKSAYNAIISGTQAMIEKGFIDRDHMGLQGQSWGGYQTGYLVTQTDMFAAAFAGAPVSNMTSAYGGIRWESGMVRTFQYESGQSRIGASLWDKPQLYIENSPIFYVDRIHTPLLIMSNDNDGAVPWYQGIEYFNAMRRLNKPAWLLCYNGDEHNLVRRANMKDLDIRMMEFFNHYLKGAPMPVWMKYGLPAVDKGLRNAYELSGDESAPDM